MTYFIKIIKIILFFFLLNNPSNAEIKIAYFDLDSILSNTNISKKLFTNLNNSEKLKIEELQKQEQNLKNEENKIRMEWINYFNGLSKNYENNI